MKKYVITGSLGNISRPLVEGLVKQGKEVKVITSKANKTQEIEKLGAKALVGDVNDAAFVKEAFKDAEVVYTMIPPIWQTNDWRKDMDRIADNYIGALQGSQVKYVVNLSSVGADVGQGCGPVDGLYDFEQKLNKLQGIQIKHLRPSYFYHNLLAQIPMIKGAGIMGGNFGGNGTVFLVHPKDIAAAALEELLNLNFTGSSVRYIAGDEKKGQEIASTLGKAIGKDLNWVEFTDEQQHQGLTGAGLPEAIAKEYTNMGNALRNDFMQADFRKHKPTLSPIKLEEFANEFAAAYKG
ncbi:NAD(P)H-binding protein [Rhodocytophaga aerolata]|uniref:NAD(P)H-binding protein n=1 Tax=Rhodocytophaga aerolata TaxID=455078 RepID=A0ABT8R016_9BACT|nr:NAD(P)H-binding protein [Rhodocytophaga aerolata]MDO1445440.1 NAD(P)H-binding protein [Rhodocytophaga aerolata]